MKETQPISIKPGIPVSKITVAILVVLNFLGEVSIPWQWIVLAGLLIALWEFILLVGTIAILKRFWERLSEILS